MTDAAAGSTSSAAVRRQRREDEEGTVGFDANRRYRDGKSNDIWILVSAIVVLGGAVLWAVGVF